MEIKTGYLYHIMEEFFDKIKDNGLMLNHKNGHSRPSYYVIKDGDILWFIPLSSKVDKYRKIVEQKIKQYGSCKTILIRKIAGRESVILIQNAFPTLEKYIESRHTIDGIYVKVSTALQREIYNSLMYMFSLKKEGINLFFADIDSIKEKLYTELYVR